MSRRFKTFFLITDVGFVVYWLIMLLHRIPPAYVFNDDTNPIPWRESRAGRPLGKQAERPS